MISINGIENQYVIDLSESAESKYILSTDSNKSINITYVSDKDAIYAYIFGRNNISIDVDKRKLKKDGIIILKDLRKNTYKIILKPDYESFRERNYTFKLGKYSVSGKSITFNVISKENNINEPWSIDTSMSPVSYDVDKKKTKVTLIISMMLATEIMSTVVLRQDNSGKEIRIKLKHIDSNSVELMKEAD